MTCTQEIPFYIELRRLYQSTECYEHELKFGVVGVDQPASMIFASDLFQSPTIIERLSDGGLKLADPLLEALAVKLYQLMANLIVEQGGQSGWWKMKDITPFIREQFSTISKDSIVETMSEFVTDQVIVENASMVADDDAI